jgi:hypothetical protein
MLVPSSIADSIPLHLKNRIQALPENIKEDFIQEYRMRLRNQPLGFAFQFFLGGSLGYTNRWFLQILHWLTFGGLGLWWVFEMFYVPMRVRAFNEKMANKVFKRTLKKYQLSLADIPVLPRGNSNSRVMTAFKEPSVDTDYNIANFKVGYLFDYATNTWEIINVDQFDYSNRYVERVYQARKGTDIMFIHLLRDGDYDRLGTAFEISLYEIKNGEQYLNTSNLFPPVLHFTNREFYLFRELQGTCFKDLSNHSEDKCKVYYYFDSTKHYYLRIELNDKSQGKAYFGTVLDPLAISHILPSSETRVNG